MFLTIKLDYFMGTDKNSFYGMLGDLWDFLVLVFFVEICLFGFFGLFLSFGVKGRAGSFFKTAIATANQFTHNIRMATGEIQLSF